jgi:hypothetical protein
MLLIQRLVLQLHTQTKLKYDYTTMQFGLTLLHYSSSNLTIPVLSHAAFFEKTRKRKYGPAKHCMCCVCEGAQILES